MDRIDILSAKAKGQLLSFVYRSKHILLYTIIGSVSIVVELIARSFLLKNNFDDVLASCLAVLFGVLLAFVANITLNFRIPRDRFFYSLMIFIIISVGSYLFQTSVINYLLVFEENYNVTRIAVSGCFFIFFYFLHLKFSFKYRQLVGIAIYVNEAENIVQIYGKVSQLPDFIHVDLVDETFVYKCLDTKPSRVEVVKALWPGKEIHVHLMSKTPSKWIETISEFSDLIFFHFEIDENIDEVKSKIESCGCKAGIVLHAKNEYPHIDKIAQNFSHLLVLSIEKPGYSGQEFLVKSHELLAKLKHLKETNDFMLCVDGGISTKNINLIESEAVVTGSAVLNSPSPPQQLLRLQTKLAYERR